MSLQLMSYTMYTRQDLNVLALKSFASLAYSIESGCPNSRNCWKRIFLSLLRSATSRPGEFFPPPGVHFLS